MTYAPIIRLSSAAIPGIPQNVTANRIPLTSDDCVILLRWMPPSVAESSINHYIVDSPAGRFTTRDTSALITLLIHHCNITTYIRISAIDFCGRGGPSTNDTLRQLLIGPSDSTTWPVTATPTTDNGDSNQQSGDCGELNSYIMLCKSSYTYMYSVAYSEKFSREETFTNFAV
jgi:hypothetical protein